VQFNAGEIPGVGKVERLISPFSNPIEACPRQQTSSAPASLLVGDDETCQIPARWRDVPWSVFSGSKVSGSPESDNGVADLCDKGQALWIDRRHGSFDQRKQIRWVTSQPLRFDRAQVAHVIRDS